MSAESVLAVEHACPGVPDVGVACKRRVLLCATRSHELMGRDRGMRIALGIEIDTLWRRRGPALHIVVGARRVHAPLWRWTHRRPAWLRNLLLDASVLGVRGRGRSTASHKGRSTPNHQDDQSRESDTMHGDAFCNRRSIGRSKPITRMGPRALLQLCVGGVAACVDCLRRISARVCLASRRSCVGVCAEREDERAMNDGPITRELPGWMAIDDRG